MMINLLTEYGPCRTNRSGFFHKTLVKKSLRNSHEEILCEVLRKYLRKTPKKTISNETSGKPIFTFLQ